MGLARSTDDPENLCRIRFYVPEVFGSVDTEDTWTDWALPVYPWFSRNGVGEALFPGNPRPSGGFGEVTTAESLAQLGFIVMFRGGDPRFPFWLGVFPLQGTELSRTLVRIEAEEVELAAACSHNPLTGDGVVLASGTDPFTGTTYGALGNASTRVFAKKA